MTRQAVKRGIINTYNSTTNTASVLLLEATSTTLDNVPTARNLNATVGDFCAVLFFDEVNYTDAVVIASFPRQ